MLLRHQAWGTGRHQDWVPILSLGKRPYNARWTFEGEQVRLAAIGKAYAGKQGPEGLERSSGRSRDE